jgi:lipopolysaccharide export system permease protein
MVGSILNRTIFWELVRVFLLALAGLTALFLLAGLIQQATQLGLSPRQVFFAIPLLIPSTLPYTIPATTLFASCVVYGRLAHDNEVVAIKGAGVHLIHVLKPALVLGVLTTAVTGWLYHSVIPRSQQMLQQQILEDPEEVLYNALRRDKCIRQSNSPYVLYVRDVQGRRLIDVVVKRRAKVADKKTGAETYLGYDLVARSREARLEVDTDAGMLYIHPDRFTFDTRSQPSDRPLQARDADRDVKTTTQGTTAANGSLGVPLPDYLTGKDIKGRPMALTWDDLAPRVEELRQEREGIEEKRREANRSAAQTADPGQKRALLDQDPHYRAQVEAVNRQLRNVEAEFHVRPALACGCLVFALIGCPVGIWANRADYLSTFVICFLPTVVVYYPLLLAGSNMGKDGKIPLGLGCWLANIAVGTAGLALTWRLLRR